MYLYVCVSGIIKPYSTNRKTNNKNKKLFPVAVSLCANAVIRTGIEIHLRINLLLLVS